MCVCEERSISRLPVADVGSPTMMWDSNCCSRPWRRRKKKQRRRRNTQPPTALLCFLAAAAAAAAAVAAADEEAVSDVVLCSVRDLRPKPVSPTSVELTWRTVGCPVVLSHKVYLSHRRFLACPPGAAEGSSNSSSSVEETGATESIRLKGLHPFSEYTAEVTALLPRGAVAASPEFSFRTPEGVPELRPRRGKQPTLAYKQALKFFWMQPEAGEGDGDELCQRRNGRADGHHVELWALDSWAVEGKGGNGDLGRAVWRHNKKESVNFAYVDGLVEHTRYMLRVYARNAGGQWNQALPLELRSRTLPSTPRPPKLEKALPSTNSVHLRWRPAYPPTGFVQKYVVRVGKGDDEKKIVWLNWYDVPGNQWCVGEDDKPAWNRSVCWQPSQLKPDTRYHFEVQTTNRDVETASNYSSISSVWTKKASPTATSTPAPSSVVTPWSITNYRPDNEEMGHQGSGESGGTDPLVVVLGLGLAMLVLVVIVVVLFYKIKVNKLKMHYEQGGGGEGGGYPRISPPLPQQQQQSMMNLSPIRSPPGRSGQVIGNGNASAGDSTFVSTATDLTLAGSDFTPRWTSQVVEIQSRRLPEPPPQTDSLSSFLRTPSGKRKESFALRNGSGNSSSRSAVGGANPNKDHLYEDADAAMEEEDDDDSDVDGREGGGDDGLCLDTTSGSLADIVGYLRPTFRNRSPSPEKDVTGDRGGGGGAVASPPSPPPDAIRPESYATPADVAALPSAPPINYINDTLNSSKESGGSMAAADRPLIAPSSVQV